MPTLRDDATVTAFVNAVQQNAFDLWSTLTAQQRGEVVVQAAIDALQSCGVPPPGRDVRALAPGYLGFFNFGPWALQISNTIFAGAPTVDVAETVYHEARHCEQWFYMARFHALGRGKTVPEMAQAIRRGLGIKSIAVCNQAAIRPIRYGDPMLGSAKAWYESVYGRSSREIVLTTLGLNRTGTTLVSLDDFHNHVHAQYSGGLPEEVDAWGIQVLVRNKFRALYPPLRALPFTAAQWKTKTGRNILHFRSADLTVLDNALATYEQTPSRGASTQLRTAFNRWQEKNPKEATTRNVDQCVTQLRTFLEAA